MTPIHQLYCTHCTYGSSALERREGELADRTLGYGVRAASIEQGQLRRVYQQIERSLYYYLPRDTPAEDRLRLTAATAPRRLIFLPAVGGLQVIARICYRARDSEGRPGSYFAHVLLRARTPAAAPWTCLDALRLWDAPGWASEDSPDAPYVLSPLTSLDAMLRGGKAAVDDEAVLQYLMLRPRAEGGRVAGLLPARWHPMGQAERTAILRDLVIGLQETVAGQARPVLLLAEPSAAALLFHAAVRLLPEGTLREAIDVSTFEAEPSQVHTRLAAVWTAHPPRTAEAAVHHGRALVVATTPHQRPGSASPAGAYADLVLSRLFQGGWAQADRTLEGFRACGPVVLDDLGPLAAAEQAVPRLLQSGAVPSASSWGDAPRAQEHFQRHLADALAAMPDPPSALAPLVGRPAHRLLLETFSDGRFPQADEATAFLARSVPPAMVPECLASERIAARTKVAMLAARTAPQGRLPPGCEWIWHEAAQPPRSRSRSDEELLLPALLAALDEAPAEALCRNEGFGLVRRLLPALVEACARNPARARTLGRVLRELPEPALLSALKTLGPGFLHGYPGGEPVMGQRLGEVLRDLPRNPAQWSARLDVVHAGAHLLPTETDRRVAAAWERLRAALAAAQRAAAPASESPGPATTEPIDGASRQVCEAAAQALPGDRFADDVRGTRKIALLARLAPELFGAGPPAAGRPWLQRALRQKLEWYFETQQWPSVPLWKMRAAGWSMGRVWLVAIAVALVVAAVAVGAFWALASANTSRGATPREPPRRLCEAASAAGHRLPAAGARSVMVGGSRGKMVQHQHFFSAARNG